MHIFDPRGKIIQTVEGVPDAGWIVPFENENGVTFSTKLLLCQSRECVVYQC